ncbi:MAG: hypothetical protein LH614_15095 [Pyrinomonadaceae bacterium]|nr:hypothetical protein [Pyrinomonadaceae bacterium]
MKICPNCQTQFDNEEIYCLHDGSILVAKSPNSGSEETIVFAPFKTNQNNKTATQTSKAIYPLIGIAAILVIALAGFFFWKQNETKDEKAQANSSATANDYELKKKELELKEKELEIKKQELIEGQKNSQPTVSQPTPRPFSEKPLPPVQSPNNADGTKYSGSIGSSNAVFNLSWNKNKTVTGSYYFTGNPSQTYGLSGTNYTDGEIELQEFGNLNARIRMFKNLKGNTLCWNGSYYATNGTSTINFCRYR